MAKLIHMKSEEEQIKELTTIVEMSEMIIKNKDKRIDLLNIDKSNLQQRLTEANKHVWTASIIALFILLCLIAVTYDDCKQHERNKVVETVNELNADIADKANDVIKLCKFQKGLIEELTVFDGLQSDSEREQHIDSLKVKRNNIKQNAKCQE